MTRPTQTVALPVRLWRLTRLSLHVLGGLWQVLTRFQRLPAAQRHAVHAQVDVQRAQQFF